MGMVYTIAAAIGCTLLTVQIVLQLMGMGGDTDVHFDADVGTDLDAGDVESNIFFGFLSFKSLTAFLAFFGLTGLACGKLGISSGALTIVLSTLAGIGAGTVVMFIMRGLSALQASGTVNLDDAIGQSARVYLRIPARSGGAGKITVTVGGQERELQAITPGEELPTGSRVEIVRRVEGDTFEVVKV